MPELSPAAQAILNASTSVFWRPPIDVPAFQNKSVAAALRAVIETCAHTDFGDHWVIPASDLERIADEIEAQ